MRTVLSWDDYQDDVGVVGSLAVEKTGETDRDDTARRAGRADRSTGGTATVPRRHAAA